MQMPGTTVKDVAAHDFVRAYAAFLKRSGKITPPKWAELVKTAVYKELSPYDPDWFYVRCAAIARRVYMKPGVGVGALCKSFGGSRNNGTAPSHHHPATSNIQRKALQVCVSSAVPCVFIRILCSPGPRER